MDKVLLQLEITAESPLAFPERRIGNRYYRSRDYIPSSSLFGAMGDNGRFDQRLFQNIRVHNAYPMRAGDDWVRPLPATAQQPKSAKSHDSIIDTLIYRVCWEQQQPTAYVYSPRDDELRPYEPVGFAYYTLNKQPRKVYQHTTTRVSINPYTRTAKEGLLYSFSHLDEWHKHDDKWSPTQFLGSLVVNHTDQQRVDEIITSVDAIGGRKSSGIGSVNCTIRANTHEIFSKQHLQQRIELLTAQFAEVIQANTLLGGKDWDVNDCSFFTINLMSDAILHREGWIPSHTYSAQQLLEDTGINVDLIRSFTQAAVIGGWNTTWQRHRESTVATRTNGIFLFKSKGRLQDADYEKLYQLQLNGIGSRCNEGFGQIMICDPFHI